MPRIKNNQWYLLFIAYILGLLCTNLPLSRLQVSNIWQGVIFAIVVIIASQVIRFIIAHNFRWQVDSRWWLISALVVIMAFYYYHWRLPTVSQTDISHQLSQMEKSGANNFNITLKGKILTIPTINQRYQARFELQALELKNDNHSPTTVTGKVYVTAPLLMTTGLYPSQIISLTGRIYQPSRQLNPGGFDFADYLALRGIFTGFSAEKIAIQTEGNNFAKYRLQLRQRVIKTHVRYLKMEMGSLVSGVTIGNRGIDMPYDLLDSFRRIGLAHAISASGFHVSLLLTAILIVTQSQSPQVKFFSGLIGLLIYISLTGFYPSMLRSSLMGIAVLIGVINDRRVKVSASLLLVAVILLIINPLWIWDLGFQFSFLATWGLIANSSAIVKRLDYLPPNISQLISVPLVATIWVLPLQCYVFKGFSPYCILINIIAMLLIIPISLGGMATGFIGIFSPVIGSYFTVLLMPFTWILIRIVNFFVNLPYSLVAVGQISAIIILICYGFLFLLNVSVWWQKKWLKSSLCLLIIIIFPLIYQRFNLEQITILKTNFQPSIVVQNQWQTGVININDKDNIGFTLKPFLFSQGVNKINFVYQDDSTNYKLSLSYFARQFQLKQVIDSVNINSLDNLKATKLNNFQQKNGILNFDFKNLKWLIINTDQKLTELNEKLQSDVLIYSGNNLSLKQLQKLNPKIAIAFSNFILPEHLEYFKQNKITVFNTQKDGAIQWQPKTGFRAYGTNYDTI